MGVDAPIPSQLLAAFEDSRPELIALAYRMLGDLARAEDIVQDAWLRWREASDIRSPKAYLITIVTRLCLNELGSARVRREHSRADRLPEPVDLRANGLLKLERLEQVSMAFMVVLQRLLPAERAVLLLHDVFDLQHREIAELIGQSVPACRKLLERAHKGIAAERRMLQPQPGEHRRLLDAFVSAALAGDTRALIELLAGDASMVTDGGPQGRVLAGTRNLPRPLTGNERIAAFVIATTQRARSNLTLDMRELNGQPAMVFWADHEPSAALLLAVADGKIQRVYFHADLERLRHVGEA